jgi:hypothetical protein
MSDSYPLPTEPEGVILTLAPTQQGGQITAIAITSRSRGVRVSKRARRTAIVFSFSSAISREAQLNRIQQVLIAERLGQELDRTFLHRLNGHRNVGVCRD